MCDTPRAVWFRYALVAALLFGPVRPAYAYENHLTFSAGAGYAAALAQTPTPRHGVATQLAIGIGLGDLFELRLLVPYTIQFDQTVLHRVSPGLEFVYLFDLLEIVPFFGAGIDLPSSFYQDEDRVDFAAHAVVGVDWLLSREWAIGLEARPYLMITALEREPTWLTALVRALWLYEVVP